MAARRHRVYSLAENFRRLVPAIYHMSRELNIPEATTNLDSTGIITSTSDPYKFYFR